MILVTKEPQSSYAKLRFGIAFNLDGSFSVRAGRSEWVIFREVSA